MLLWKVHKIYLTTLEENRLLFVIRLLSVKHHPVRIH